jgi:hypothetical protein
VRRVAEIGRILHPLPESREFYRELDKNINNLAAEIEKRYGN